MAAADQVDGVQDAKATASRSKVSMQIVSTGGGNVADEVRAAVTERLEALEKPVKVTVRTQGGPR